MMRAPEVGTLLVTDHVLLNVLTVLTSNEPICRLSTRQLSELSGMSRKTVSRSLSRLSAARRITKERDALGNHPAHWRVRTDVNRPEMASVPLARNDPGHMDAVGLHDTFRRRDLRGPGALYWELPEGTEFTALEVLAETRLTQRLRTVEHWLLVLGSLPSPLVEVTDSRAGCDLWRKVPVTASTLQDNVEILLTVGGSSPLVTRAEVRLRHQLERAARMFPRASAA